MKDYYKILGITTSASQQEIKKVYRGLAMQFHPDKNPDNEFAHARFVEIQEAYTVLADPIRRERYDDERWLNGMGKRTDYTQAVTPEWLLNMSRNLNQSLAQMDIHRISHQALQAYILLILSDAHIGVLKQYNDAAKDALIVAELLKATARLEYKYVSAICQRLHIIAAGRADMERVIDNTEKEKQEKEKRERLFPYIILLVTLALCMLMYIYGKL